ncbi:hypothetical protein Taro_054387, partial [Colocasia esculenta]|nr:hypothetical protein [Colocasia esculenta]
SLFARCSALEGLSHLEVVSVSWDPHPREPVEGVFRATSVLELAAHTSRCLEFLTQTRQSLSHCLSLRWFRSHVVVLGVRPQLGQAAVLRVLRVLGGSVSPFVGAEAGARLASRGLGRCVPFLAASGGGLRFLTTFLSVTRCPSLHGGHSLAVPRFRGRRWSGLVQTSVFSGSRFGVLLASQFCSRVPVRGGTGVCGLPTSWRVQGPEWFCVWALDLVEESCVWPDLVGGRGVALFCSTAW